MEHEERGTATGQTIGEATGQTTGETTGCCLLGWVGRLLRRHRVVVAALVLGGIAGASAMGLSVYAVHATSTTQFCLSCHEMRYVAQQGWMHSTHYSGRSGVVATCSDCHIPPGLWPMLWTKMRDGTHDIYVHLFGEHDPKKMDWERLRRSARAKIHDSACRRCHANMTSPGMGLKAIMAHRQYLRGLGHNKCIDCHDRPIHGRYRTQLAGVGSDR